MRRSCDYWRRIATASLILAKDHDANPAMARITRQRREQAKVGFSSGRFPTIPATSANSEVAQMMR
jgi:hypothetical protein